MDEPITIIPCGHSFCKKCKSAYDKGFCVKCGVKGKVIFIKSRLILYIEMN